MEATTTRGSIGAARPAPRGLAITVARTILAALVVVVAVIAGTGLLYLVHRWALLKIGPRIPGALPLQQLAGGEGQPLLRMIVAWIPAGFVAGFAAASIAPFGRVVRIAGATILSAVLLLLAGAAADAIAITDPLGPHLLPQLHRIGTWVAVGLFAIGAALAEFAPTRRE